jgi:hypothetical protein
VQFYADVEGGAHLPDPTRTDLIDLIGTLNGTDNTFFVVSPADRDLEWFISVSKNVGTFGGYELDRDDPAIGEHATTTASDPDTIATDVLEWISRR